MYPSGNRAVVTGGAGFIGSHLVDRLLADGFGEVVVFDDLSRGTLRNLSAHQGHPRLQIVRGDVRDATAVAKAMQGASVVFHLGAQSAVVSGLQDEEHTFTTNVVGTFNVLRAAARAGVRRLIFTSSRQVYGEPIALPVDEDHPLMAVDPYGASKAAGEIYCRAFRRKYGLTTVILRLANVYGPRDAGHAIPEWVAQAAAGDELRVDGGKQLIDFVWVGHVVEALVRAAAVDGSLPPINVASGTGTRILDLARRIARLAQTQAPIKLLPEPEIGVTRFVANVDRMRQLLRIEPLLDPLAFLPALFSHGADGAPAALASNLTEAGGAYVQPA